MMGTSQGWAECMNSDGRQYGIWTLLRTVLFLHSAGSSHSEKVAVLVAGPRFSDGDTQPPTRQPLAYRRSAGHQRNQDPQPSLHALGAPHGPRPSLGGAGAGGTGLGHPARILNDSV